MTDTADLGPCWLWYGSTNKDGYGRSGKQRQGKPYLAHRWVYEELVGPIPEGLTLDHLCRNPTCVNPQHLEPVPIAENCRRGARATQTHCKYGHEFTEENTYRRAHGRRECRVCIREREKRRCRVRT